MIPSNTVITTDAFKAFVDADAMHLMDDIIPDRKIGIGKNFFPRLGRRFRVFCRMPAQRLLRFGAARRKRNADELFRRHLKTVERKACDRHRLRRSRRIGRCGIESRNPVFR